ncbi:YcbK family protein [Methylomonas sp. MgM2]
MLENHNDEQENVELSRRGFFSRFALGAVLSIAVPSIAHASKSATEKSRQIKSARAAVRLPKYKSKAVNSSKRESVATVKKARSAKTAGHLHVAHSNSTANARVRDIYNGKKQGTNAVIQHVGQSQGHMERTHSSVGPFSREIITDSADSLHIADRGRLATHRSLAFQNPHTGEKLGLTYFEKGRYLSDALDEISYLLRDYRTGDIHPIDPELLDQLHDLKQMMGLAQPFGVICGYRSPLTNAKLHAEHRGVANNSFHMYGRAVDIRIERFDLRRIHNAAIAMHRGGVGYYPESNFIHLDTGTFRTWSL